MKQMKPEEITEFYIDPKVIDWSNTVQSYVHGIQKFCLKQESLAPGQNSTALIRKNDFEYFEDLRWAFFNGKPILSQDLMQIRRDVLSSSILQNFIHSEIKQKKVLGPGKKPKPESEVQAQLLAQAEKYLTEIEAQLRPSVVRSALWVFQKIWQRVYDQIIVNESQLKELRDLLQSKHSNVVLVPTHKSYMDSILLGYIHYHYKLDYPFVCGSEAFFSLALISILIKSTNGFHFNSNNMKSNLYRAVI